MRLTLCAAVALLTLGACGTDNPAASKGSYATGQLPTADSVQRESDIRMADQEAAENRADAEHADSVPTDEGG